MEENIVSNAAIANDTVEKERILLAGKNGKSDLNDFLPGVSVNNSKIDAILEAAKKEHEINKIFEKDVAVIKENLTKAGVFNEKGEFAEAKALSKGSVKELRAWAQNNPNLIMEVADNGATRVWERANRYDDPGTQYVVKRKIETAEDDRVLGIPYAQAMAGDRVYIVNGKIFTGWALYFSLSSIKSPEDYARNIDLIYNVPYLYGAIQLKSQLGLGCGYAVNYGAESLEVSEEKVIRRYLQDKLKIKTPLLIKTGFHLYSYGNAYWALRRGQDGLPDKITILQPERLKIFLDPMTTRIMFYIYLPPIIGGTTIASYPSDGRVNPNILSGVTLSYPTPIVMHPEDIIHFKINDFTEYPFGFSDVKSCIDPATARLDINILAPILFKKYTKPMVHWSLNTDGIAARQVTSKQEEMIAMLQDMEPGSDPVTTDRWKPTVITVGQGKGSILELTSDIDTQIFAATGAPESYFKAKGSTDRMISEQDKTFLARLKIVQEIVSEKVEEQLIIPKIYKVLKEKHDVDALIGSEDKIDNYLKSVDSWLATEPKIPKMVWKETFKQDETQAISNAIALLNAGVIDKDRAAMKIGEVPMTQQLHEDLGKESIDYMPTSTIPQSEQVLPENPDKRAMGNTPSNYNEQENMEMLRGGLKVGENFDTRNRNAIDVKDPSQLGGSRYAQHALKGDKGDIQQKHQH